MAFFVRRPFALTAALKEIPKPSSTARAFHNTPLKASPKASSTPKATSFVKDARQTFQNVFRRTYMNEPYQQARPQVGNIGGKLLLGGAVVGGTVLATNFLFNRETREDGGMPPFERSYLNETFVHTGLGVGIIGLAASALHRNGWSYRLMAANPWAVLGIGLVGSIGTMIGCQMTSPDK